jgi:hypothetical protein
MVGTIDKLAALGNKRNLAQVFGQVDGRCTLHGYYKGKCCQKDCSGGQRLRPGKPRGLSGPTLFVQDELHLLKEGLGTFDGHYETFTQQLQQEFDPNSPTLKVIASSATIEAFERQVEHLVWSETKSGKDFPRAWSQFARIVLRSDPKLSIQIVCGYFASQQDNLQHNFRIDRVLSP